METITRLGSRPMINKPPPLGRDFNRDPNIKALKRRELINRGSTLRGQEWGSIP